MGKSSKSQNAKPYMGMQPGMLHKLLFQVIQCIHHLYQLHQPGSNTATRLPKAFLKKQDEWNRFIRPAQASKTQFQKQYSGFVTEFLNSTVAGLVSHYEECLDQLYFQCNANLTTVVELDKCTQIAKSWANKSFGKKINQNTRNVFNQFINQLKNAIVNSQKNPTSKSKSPNQPQNCPPQLPKTSNANKQTQPISASPKNKQTPAQNQTSNQAPKWPQTHNNSQTTPKPPQSQTQKNPSLTPKSGPNQAKNNPKTKTTTNEDSQLPSTSIANPNPIPQWDPQNKPQNVKGPKDPLSNFFNCKFCFRGNWFRSAEHAYQHTKATFLGYEDVANTIHNAPNAFNAKALSKSLKSCPNFPKWESVKVCVMREILSCKYNQVVAFRDALIATAGTRLTHEVLDAFWGSLYKNKNGKTFPGKDIFSRLLMELRESKLSCGTQNTQALLTPTQTKNASFNHGAGSATPPTNQDLFFDNSTLTSSTVAQLPPTENAHFNHEACSVTTPTQNRFSALQSYDINFPPLPSQTTNTSPTTNTTQTSPKQHITTQNKTPKTNIKQTTQKQPHTAQNTVPTQKANPMHTSPNQLNTTQNNTMPSQQSHNQTPCKTMHTLAIGPKLTTHTGAKCKWPIPKFSSKIALLGDSNLSKISHAPNEIESVQADSFPGAHIQHITKIIQQHNTNQQAPDVLILSVGINNRGNQPQTHHTNVTGLVKAASQKFPTTKVYIPQINFSESLPEKQKQSLLSLNKLFGIFASKNNNIHTIPPLNQNEFQTGNDLIHWTPETANKTLANWIKHLN